MKTIQAAAIAKLSALVAACVLFAPIAYATLNQAARIVA